MVPCSFDEANVVLSRPPDMTADQCDPLSVLCASSPAGPVVVSCWKLTKAELDEIVRNGGIVWLTVYGQTMPPVVLSGQRPF